jgi:hypothetical protein
MYLIRPFLRNSSKQKHWALPDGDWLREEPIELFLKSKGDSESSMRGVSEIYHTNFSPMQQKKFRLKLKEFTERMLTPRNLYNFLYDTREVTGNDEFSKYLYEAYARPELFKILDHKKKSLLNTDDSSIPSDFSVVPSDIKITSVIRGKDRVIPEFHVPQITVPEEVTLSYPLARSVFFSKIPPEVISSPKAVEILRETVNSVGDIEKIEFFSNKTALVLYHLAESAADITRDPIRLFGILCRDPAGKPYDPKKKDANGKRTGPPLIFPEKVERKKTLVLSGVPWKWDISYFQDKFFNEFDMEISQINLDYYNERVKEKQSAHHGKILLRFDDFHATLACLRKITDSWVVDGRTISCGLATEKVRWKDSQWLDYDVEWKQ